MSATARPHTCRQSLPANEFARLYRDERGREDAQLDFVLFVDAVEGERKAVPRDEVAFVETPLRSKWDLAQR